MLESLNDYISLGLLIFLVIGGLRLMMAALYYRDDHVSSTRYSVFIGYNDNEDD